MFRVSIRWFPPIIHPQTHPKNCCESLATSKFGKLLTCWNWLTCDIVDKCLKHGHYCNLVKLVDVWHVGKSLRYGNFETNYKSWPGPLAKKIRFHFLQDKTVAAPIQTLCMISTSETSENLANTCIHPSPIGRTVTHCIYVDMLWIRVHKTLTRLENRNKWTHFGHIRKITAWFSPPHRQSTFGPTATALWRSTGSKRSRLEPYSFPLSQDSNIFHKVKTQLLLPDGVMFHRWYTSFRPAQTVGTALGLCTDTEGRKHNVRFRRFASHSARMAFTPNRPCSPAPPPNNDSALR